MNTRNLLLTIGAAALTVITTNATASDAPLVSPRATANQIKHVSATNNEPGVLAANNSGVTLPPRAVVCQIKYVKGTNNDVNPALACAKNMRGSSPKAIAACADHPGAPMPCCAVAATK